MCACRGGTSTPCATCPFQQETVIIRECALGWRMAVFPLAQFLRTSRFSWPVWLEMLAAGRERTAGNTFVPNGSSSRVSLRPADGAGGLSRHSC
jgi:hypothetical protein